MPATISLCMIAKNEDRFIGRCIQSALPYVNQVIIVDTGSSDKTPEIAKEFGAEVWHFSWVDDFSAARNFSLEKATGDWIIFMDCDEEFDQTQVENLLAGVESSKYDAYYINVRNLLGGNNTVTFQSIRLFRNLPQFRFKGKIHEQISDSVLQHSGARRIGRLNFNLIHHGYNPEQVNIQSKIARNVHLLEKQQHQPEGQEGFYFYNLGVEYVRQGQYQRALENFIQALKVTNTTSGYAPPLVNKLIVCLIELNRYRDALEQLSYFQSVYPDYSDLYLLEAACHLRCGRYSLAAQSINKAQHSKNMNTNYPSEGTIFNQSPEQILSQLQPFLLANLKNFKLNVCILAKNEEKNIHTCMRSIGEIADKVLLIVTECSENTLHISYQMGAHLYRVNWEDSFAKLRNFALQRVDGDWILFLNGDEELCQADLPVLIEELNTAIDSGYKVRIRTFWGDDDRNYQDCSCCKIVRNDKTLYYSSRLLEDIDQSIIHKHDHNRISCLPVTIFNHGPKLRSHLREADFISNIRLIAKDFKTLGKNTFLHQAMGNDFYKMRRYKPALAHFKRAMVLSKEKVAADLYLSVIKCLCKLTQYREGLELANISVDQFPDYTDLVYYQGYCHLKLKNWPEARECFERCLMLGDAPWQKYTVSSGVGSYLPHCRLAELYFQQGNIKKSLVHYSFAAVTPAGAVEAIPPLTRLLLSNYEQGKILQYFTENELDSCQNLCEAAISANKNGCLLESLELWQAAVEKFIHSQNTQDYHYIAKAMFQVLGDTYGEAIKQNPTSQQLLRVAHYFKTEALK